VTRITTHVLDTSTGRPAEGVPVALEGVGGAVTDGDGRATLGDADAGRHRLVFEVGELSPFYTEIALAFVVPEGEDHLHVPLLLSPWGCTTYRGS
jgi:5-hydroxyisourate hydrolase